MDYKMLKRILILFIFQIAIILPLYIAQAGGVYTQTKHGDSSTGVLRDNSIERADCRQCHIEHSAGGTPNTYALFAPNTNGLCFTTSGTSPCHNSASSLGIFQGSVKYGDSSHATDSQVVWPGPNPSARPASDSGKCVNCHSPHGYEDGNGLIPSQLIKREENLCLTCHDSNGPASTDIQTDISKTYRHPASDYTGRHSEDEDGTASNYGTSPSNNRHAECVDCHNPHIAAADTSPPSAPTMPLSLKGVGRVKVSNGSAGTTPSFTYVSPSNNSTPLREYQICFKCHSSWTSQPSGQPDLSVKFNTNNPSYHPVEAQGKNLNINPNAFVNGWSDTDLMYCSDCHGSDSGTANGPHGSTYNFILKNNYVQSTAKRTMSSNEICFNCHRYDTYGNPNSSKTVRKYSRFEKHHEHIKKQYTCYNCHDSHGSTEKPHLIVTGRNPGVIDYNETQNGGSCRPTCHGWESYNVTYPR
ncbi:MAG: hypothetical protein D6734_00705 [Candidatus Schekmanbacteria bacterium]|nr:MAG: hypothetical protein D6734_00705 [Candidatus Schekmanbacteria bacterium]